MPRRDSEWRLYQRINLRIARSLSLMKRFFLQWLAIQILPWRTSSILSNHGVGKCIITFNRSDDCLTPSGLGDRCLCSLVKLAFHEIGNCRDRIGRTMNGVERINPIRRSRRWWMHAVTQHNRSRRKTRRSNFCPFQMYAVRGGKLSLKGADDDSSHAKKRKKSSSSSQSKKQKHLPENDVDDGEQDFVQ